VVEETNIGDRFERINCYIELFYKCGANNTIVKDRKINYDNVIKIYKDLKEERWILNMKQK
jgi:hypothetical protein